MLQVAEAEYIAVNSANPPWYSAPVGVVSLLDMLRFAADQFFLISNLLSRLSNIRASLVVPNIESDGIRTITRDLQAIKEHCEEIELNLSVLQVDRILAFMGTRQCSYQDLKSFIEELHNRIHDELKTRQFFCIEESKRKYSNPAWVLFSPVETNFALAADELKAAGRCYAYGENTACVFHLMRVVDYGLRRVADSLGITYDVRNWNGIADAIRKNMEQKYQGKSEEWKQREPFYAEILTDIQAIGRGHRNPALHELEKKYDEREAQYMLTVVEGFMRHVVKQL